MLQVLIEIETGKTHIPSDVSLKLIAAIWGVEIQVMAKICHRVLDGFGMPVEWALCIMVPSITGKVDIRNCSCY